MTTRQPNETTLLQSTGIMSGENILDGLSHILGGIAAHRARNSEPAIKDQLRKIYGELDTAYQKFYQLRERDDYRERG